MINPTSSSQREHYLRWDEPINHAALHEALNLEFVGRVTAIGVSTGDYGELGNLYLVFDGPLNDSDLLAMGAVLRAHDAAQLTERQQQRAPKQQLTADLEAQVTAFDLSKPLNDEQRDVALRLQLARG